MASVTIRKTKRPIAGAVDNVIERSRAEANREPIMGRDQHRQGQERQREDPQRREPAVPVAPKLEGRALHGGRLARFEAEWHPRSSMAHGRCAKHGSAMRDYA